MHIRSGCSPSCKFSLRNAFAMSPVYNTFGAVLRTQLLQYSEPNMPKREWENPHAKEQCLGVKMFENSKKKIWSYFRMLYLPLTLFCSWCFEEICMVTCTILYLKTDKLGIRAIPASRAIGYYLHSRGVNRKLT